MLLQASHGTRAPCKAWHAYLARYKQLLAPSRDQCLLLLQHLFCSRSQSGPAQPQWIAQLPDARSQGASAGVNHHTASQNGQQRYGVSWQTHLSTV